MNIIVRLRIAFLTPCLLVLGACELADERYPDDWPQLAATDSDRCPALTGVFRDEATLNQSRSLTLTNIPISLSGILLKKGWPFQFGARTEYAEYVSLDTENDRINFFSGGNLETIPYNKWTQDNLSCEGGIYTYLVYDTEVSANFVGVGKSKAEIEFSKTNQNDLVIKYADSTYGMLMYIYPMHADVEMWALWKDISDNEVHCEMSGDEISIRKAGACLSAGGIIASLDQ